MRIGRGRPDAAARRRPRIASAPSLIAGRRRIERGVLLGPAFVRRAAAARAGPPEERWMLLQERPVRESYVRHVLEATGDQELRRQIWMLGQPAAVRKSYVREILEPLLDVSDEAPAGRDRP